MTNKRRLVILISSVSLGTFFAALLIRSRIGTLNSLAWQQLGVNFFFALAIVFVIGIFLNKQKKKDDEAANKRENEN